MLYQVVRFFKDPHPRYGRRRIMRRNLTLSQAQEHCRNPETDCRTAKGKKRYTEIVGDWFDGYELQN